MSKKFAPILISAVIYFRNLPNGKPRYENTNGSDNGNSLQVSMSALPQDSGLCSVFSLLTINACTIFKTVNTMISENNAEVDLHEFDSQWLYKVVH